MKRFFALFLAICVSALVFTACNNNKPPVETSGDGTTAQDPNTTASTPAETTTPEETTRAFTDQNNIDSLDYDYYGRFMRDENGKPIAVAIFSWKSEKTTANIVFADSYVYDGESYPVRQVGVGQGVLNFQSQVKSITIPASVTVISKTAFNMCTSLTELNLSEGLEEIGEMAFWNCRSLETLTIPSTVKTIGANAFADCSSLKSVTLPRAFEGKTDAIFAGCSNITFNFVG